MSTTLLPFLYQTRTLQHFARTRVSTPAFQAFFHASARSHAGRVARRAPRPKYDTIPFELPPDHQAETLEPGHRSTITPTERDAFDRIFEEIASRGRAPADTPPENNRLPGAAGQFLPDLFPGDPKPTTSRSYYDVDPSAPDEAKEATNREYLNVIISDAAQISTKPGRPLGFKKGALPPTNRAPFGRSTPLGQLRGAKETEKALLRFPASLRRAAKLALGVIDAERHNTDDYRLLTDTAPSYLPDLSARAELDVLDDLSNNPLSEQIATEARRRVERTRVEGRMHAAKTDFELWDVLEEEVFSMVDKLGIRDDPTTAVAAAKERSKKISNKKRKKKGAAPTAEDIVTAAAMEEENDKNMSMKVYGPLYPAFLLSALRLMDQSFARSSPMALNLLPRIKELGLMSFILGVSTPFYNTLAGILWYRYGDVKAVLNLFEEMRHVGLYGESGTAALLDNIRWHFDACHSGEKGPFVKELIELPEFEFVLRRRIRHWVVLVNMDMKERKADYFGGPRAIQST